MPHVAGIQIAKASRLEMVAVDSATLETGAGIVGDRYHGSRHRHVSVQSATELLAAAEILGRAIDPLLTRRNVTVSDGEIPTKPGSILLLGTVRLEVVRQAAPCSLLDDTIGRGARAALRRRAGAICRVLEGGEISVGAPVVLHIDAEPPH